MQVLRCWLLGLVAASGIFSTASLSLADGGEILVFKSASCGCCGKWIEHMQRNGFKVVAHNVGNVAPFKVRHRVPEALGSCHTAVIEGYAIEGHVPAETVKRLLEERPANLVGISAPGMPQGSPGMESPTSQRYDVVAFDGKGRSWVYARH